MAKIVTSGIQTSKTIRSSNLWLKKIKLAKVLVYKESGVKYYKYGTNILLAEQ